MPGHTTPEWYFDTPLSRAKSTHLQNFYQHPISNHKPDFPIPNQAQGSQEVPRNQQRSNNNPVIAQSNFVIAETIRSVFQYSSYGQRYKATRNDFKRVINYNDDSNSNKEVEFIDVHLFYNKLSLQLLANDATICPKKRRIDNIEDEATKAPKTNIAREKKVPVKRVGKISSKASVPISGLVRHPALNIQALFIKTNIVIPALHLFQISPKFREETRHFMTVSHKPCKKKVISPILEEEEELYAGVNYLKQDTVDTNHTLLQTPKQELNEILQSKEEEFSMKATIWKNRDETKFALLDSHVRADQGSNLVMINSKLVKKLGLKIRPTSIFVSHYFGIFVANGDSTELES